MQSVVLQYKLVRGRYEREHARLEVQHTGRWANFSQIKWRAEENSCMSQAKDDEDYSELELLASQALKNIEKV